MNNRRSERYRTIGKATLTAVGRHLTGSIYDLSMQGVGILLDHATTQLISQRMTWICRVEAPDMPAPVDLLIRVTRQRNWRGGSELGCQIVAVNERSARLLRAFSAYARTRKAPSKIRQKRIVQ